MFDLRALTIIAAILAFVSFMLVILDIAESMKETNRHLSVISESFSGSFAEVGVSTN